MTERGYKSSELPTSSHLAAGSRRLTSETCSDPARAGARGIRRVQPTAAKGALRAAASLLVLGKRGSAPYPTTCRQCVRRWTGVRVSRPTYRLTHPMAGLFTKAYGRVLAPGPARSDPTLPVRVGRHRRPWPGVASTWASTPASTSEWLPPET